MVYFFIFILNIDKNPVCSAASDLSLHRLPVFNVQAYTNMDQLDRSDHVIKVKLFRLNARAMRFFKTTSSHTEKFSCFSHPTPLTYVLH